MRSVSEGGGGSRLEKRYGREGTKRRSCCARPLHSVSFPCAAKFSSYRLVVFFAAMSCATMCGRAMGGAMRFTTMWCCGVRVMCRGITMASAYYRYAVSMIRGGAMSTVISTDATVASASSAAEAMTTPAMAVAPIRPWAHAQEDAAIEVARSIIATGCTAIRCIAVVAVDANGWGDADGNLSVDGWHEGQGRE